MIPPDSAHMHQRVWSPYDNATDWRATKNGLIIPHRDRKARYGPYPLGLDLFAGCGGMSLGFVQAGFRVIGAAEWEEWAALTYMMNLGTYPIDIHYVGPEDKARLDKTLNKEIKRRSKNGLATNMPLSGSGSIRTMDVPGVPHFWFGDICQISGAQILDALELEVGDLDCVMGGPPCQGFSTANSKRSPDDPRNSLVFEFCRLVIELQPKAMLLENVPAMARMTTPEGINMVDAVCRYLEDGGYGYMDALRKSLMQTAGLGAAWKAEGERAKREETESRQQRRKAGRERGKGKGAASEAAQMAFEMEAAL